MEEEDCPICLTNLKTEEDIVELQCCKKTLHVTCYIKCMEQKKECPMCRKQNKKYEELHSEITIIPNHFVPPEIIVIERQYEVRQPYRNSRVTCIPAFVATLFMGAIIIGNLDKFQ
jgi:hypothetical protein